MLAATLLATTFLGGCSQTGNGLFGSDVFALKSRPAAKADAVVAKKPATVGTRDEKSKTDPITTAASKPVAEPVERTASAWCDYLRNDAAANAEIIASPTLSASTDEEGNGSFDIGMNLLDLKKAELIRQSGEAKCEAHAAGKSIAMTMRLADESTRFAANHARYRYLADNSARLDDVVARARNLSNSGMLTIQQVNQLAGIREGLRSEMNLAKSEADKRKDMPGIDTTEIAGSNLRLARATQKLQSIDRDIRTIDAFDISVQAGYRYDDGDTTTINDDDYYAKIKFGVRLGALSSRRQFYEDQAEAARIAALGEENGGQIWQSEFAAGSIAKSLAGLRGARKSLASALAKARDSAGKLQASEQPELVFAAMKARIETVSIAAELAGVDASIRELESNQRKLGALARQ